MYNLIELFQCCSFRFLEAFGPLLPVPPSIIFLLFLGSCKQLGIERKRTYMSGSSQYNCINSRPHPTPHLPNRTYLTTHQPPPRSILGRMPQTSNNTNSLPSDQGRGLKIPSKPSIQETNAKLLFTTLLLLRNKVVFFEKCLYLKTKNKGFTQRNRKIKLTQNVVFFPKNREIKVSRNSDLRNRKINTSRKLLCYKVFLFTSLLGNPYIT